MVTIDTRKAVAEIKRQFKSLNKQQHNVALARALNHTIAKGKTEASRQIRSVYALKAAKVNEAMKVSKAYATNPIAKINARITPLSLMNFGSPRQTKRGVAVTVIKGQRKTIRGAFMLDISDPKRKRGQIGKNPTKVRIFARGSYVNGAGFVFRKQRVQKWPKPDFPIAPLQGVSIASAFFNETVTRAMMSKVSTDLVKRYEHELRRLLK